MKQLPKRVLSSVLTGAMLFSLMSSAGFAVGTEETPGQETTEISLNTAPAAAELVGVQALTTPGHFGQKLKAVMLEYSFAVDARQLDTESFQVLVTSNNLTGEKAEAKIARVYTNSAPELLDSGSEAGNYVIV